MLTGLLQTSALGEFGNKAWGHTQSLFPFSWTFLHSTGTRDYVSFLWTIKLKSSIKIRWPSTLNIYLFDGFAQNVNVLFIRSLFSPYPIFLYDHFENTEIFKWGSESVYIKRYLGNHGFIFHIFIVYSNTACLIFFLFHSFWQTWRTTHSLGMTLSVKSSLWKQWSTICCQRDDLCCKALAPNLENLQWAFCLQLEEWMQQKVLAYVMFHWWAVLVLFKINAW